MSTNFPTSIDSLTNPTATSKVSVISHSAQHANANDAIEALEAKVGVDGSAVTTSHDYKLGEVTSTDKAVGKTATQILTNKTLTSPTITGATESGTVADSTTRTVTGSIDAGGAVSLEIPNSATPTVNADGEIAVDTTVADFSHGVMKYFGGEEMAVVAVPVAELTSPVDGDTVVYDASADEFQIRQPTQSSGLAQTFTANQDLTAGDKVGVSLLNSGVAKAFRTATASNDQSTGETITASGLMTPISGDKFICVYEITNTTLRAVVVTVNRATMTLSLGTAVSLTTDSSQLEGGYTDICTISTDKFVVSYRSNADNTIIKAVVCTVSGTTITVGTPQTIKDYAATINLSSICKLDTDKFAIFTEDTSATHEVFACTVSGTVITVGTPVATGANIVNQVIATQLDTNKFVLYSAGEYVQIFTVSGTTITAGAQQVAGSLNADGTLGKYDCVSHTTNAFVCKAGNSHAVATVSGTVATFGANISTDGDYGYLYVVDSTNVRHFGNNSTQIANIAISGTVGTVTIISNSRFGHASHHGASRHGLFITGNGYWVLAYIDTNAIRFFIEGMSIQFLGVAQSTVSRGASVSVLMRGVDSNQSGLVIGETYAVGAGGALTLQASTVTDETATTANLVKAISATSILI